MASSALPAAAGPLTAKVLEYEQHVKAMVARAREPGYGRNDWAPLTAMVDTERFERIGIYRESMTWAEYLDFMVPWAGSKEFETSHRRITEAGDLVFFEIEERHITDDGVTTINSMNVYRFDERGLLVHLDVYLQGRLGAAAFQPPS